MDPISAVAVVTQVCNQSLLNATDRQTCDVALQVLAAVAGAPPTALGAQNVGGSPLVSSKSANTEQETKAPAPEAGQASETQTPVGDNDILNA
jgi:hypothetical protein